MSGIVVVLLVLSSATESLADKLPCEDVPQALKRGLNEERQKRWGPAASAYFQVVWDCPNSEGAPGAGLGLGRSRVRMGRVHDGLLQLQRVQDLYPDSPEAARARNLITLYFRLYGTRSLKLPLSYERDDTFQMDQHKELRDVDMIRVGSARLHAISDDTALVLTKTGRLLQAKSVSRARSLFVDDQDRVLIAGERHVLEGGAVYDGFSTLEPDGPRLLDRIRLAARDCSGNLLLYDSRQKRVLRFRHDATALGAFPDLTPREVERMEVDPSCRVLLYEKKEKEVVVYSSDGHVIARVPTRTKRYELKKLADIALDPYGNLYLLNRDPAQLAIFDPSYKLIAVLGSESLGHGTLEKPTSLDVGASGELFIYDDAKKEIIRLH